MPKKVTTLSAVVIEESGPLSLEELAQAIGISPDFIIEIVAYDLIQPSGSTQVEWRFDSRCLKRAKTAASFYHELEINMSGVALSLELLDKIERMQTRIELLEKLLK